VAAAAAVADALAVAGPALRRFCQHTRKAGFVFSVAVTRMGMLMKVKTYSARALDAGRLDAVRRNMIGRGVDERAL
jgi:hypothetical protein